MNDRRFVLRGCRFKRDVDDDDDDKLLTDRDEMEEMEEKVKGLTWKGEDDCG